MGHEDILGVETVECKLALDIFRAGSQWILAELMEQEAETGSPRLARGITRLVADQLHAVARPCELGVTQLADQCDKTSSNHKFLAPRLTCCDQHQRHSTHFTSILCISHLRVAWRTTMNHCGLTNSRSMSVAS